MEKILNFINVYKLYIIGVMLIFFFFRSCGRGRDVSRLEKKMKSTEVYIDSLQSVINSQQNIISKFPDEIIQEKLHIHMEYDNWISSRDRGSQLMELHFVVKNNISDLKK